MNVGFADKIKDEVTCKAFAEHIGLQINRAGFACCPFHGERTPSLRFYPDNKGWYCFGCKRGGDVINFAKLYYQTDFKGAVSALASEFGIAQDDNSPESKQNALLRAVQRAKVKSFTENRKRVRDAIEAEYWACYDSWLENERTIEESAPKSPDEEFSQAYVRAIMNRDLLRDRLRDVEERRNIVYGYQ